MTYPFNLNFNNIRKLMIRGDNLTLYIIDGRINCDHKIYLQTNGDILYIWNSDPVFDGQMRIISDFHRNQLRVSDDPAKNSWNISNCQFNTINISGSKNYVTIDRQYIDHYYLSLYIINSKIRLATNNIIDVLNVALYDNSSLDLNNCTIYKLYGTIDKSNIMNGTCVYDMNVSLTYGTIELNKKYSTIIKYNAIGPKYDIDLNGNNLIMKPNYNW